MTYIKITEENKVQQVSFAKGVDASSLAAGMGAVAYDGIIPPCGEDEELVWDGANVVAQAKVYTLDEVINLRAQAYKNESDPLFMEAEYDDDVAKYDSWRAKVAEIKAKYPKP